MFDGVYRKVEPLKKDSIKALPQTGRLLSGGWTALSTLFSKIPDSVESQYPREHWLPILALSWGWWCVGSLEWVQRSKRTLHFLSIAFARTGLTDGWVSVSGFPLRGFHLPVFILVCIALNVIIHTTMNEFELCCRNNWIQQGANPCVWYNLSYEHTFFFLSFFLLWSIFIAVHF